MFCNEPLRGGGGVCAPGVAQRHTFGSPADELLGPGAEQLHQTQPREGVEDAVGQGVAAGRYPGQALTKSSHMSGTATVLSVISE